MNISERTQLLASLFSYERESVIEDSMIEIIPFHFTQTTGAGEIDAFQKELAIPEFCPVTDNYIEENKNFTYNIFVPKGKRKSKEAIILLHGLNERSWDKYLTWAEFLAKETGKPIILFPIAFHMNRTPSHWCNPRKILPWVNQRKEELNNNCNTTFVNAALSSRLSKNPLRFYASGRESVFNLYQLVNEMKNGQHPIFHENVSVNLFAYSIGALLSQVILLANPGKLFSDSRLCMFCGGSIFAYMDGNARDIMDKESYVQIRDYYVNEFIEERKLPPCFPEDSWEQAFKMMIRDDKFKEQRESFFLQAYRRVRAISLKKDIVMPTEGIIKALGKASDKILEELDFPFDYSHQVPFPTNSKTDKGLINKAFNTVFSRAASFL